MMHPCTPLPLKIALFGYGNMGKMIEQMASLKGHLIETIFTPQNKAGNLASVDCIIDFTKADSVIANVHLAGKAKKNIVIGTTGWDLHLKKVQELVEEYAIGALYAPNFSLGIHLFLKLIKEAKRLFENYDTAGLEVHHTKKKDAPSGTAKAIIKVMGEQVAFSSVRLGQIPGIHTLYFDSPEDTITLTHEAKGREGFALGALAAAEWIQNRQGFFTLEDML